MSTYYTKTQSDAQATIIGNRIKNSWFDLVKLGSRFLLDPNEFCGLGVDGIYDQTHTSDLCNVGDSPVRTAGGITYPFDVQMKRMFAWHYNSAASAQAWGWRIFYQQKYENSTARDNTNILREVIGTGATAVAPRDYQNNMEQLTDIDLSDTPIVPAGKMIGWGVEAPTAEGTNRYVYVQTGYFLIEKA